MFSTRILVPSALYGIIKHLSRNQTLTVHWLASLVTLDEIPRGGTNSIAHTYNNLTHVVYMPMDGNIHFRVYVPTSNVFFMQLTEKDEQIASTWAAIFDKIVIIIRNKLRVIQHNNDNTHTHTLSHLQFLLATLHRFTHYPMWNVIFK